MQVYTGNIHHIFLQREIFTCTKNEVMNCLCYDFQFYVVMAHAKIDCDCVHDEFNKASQSLTEVVVSSVQKKTALNRLVKVV